MSRCRPTKARPIATVEKYCSDGLLFLFSVFFFFFFSNRLTRLQRTAQHGFGYSVCRISDRPAIRLCTDVVISQRRLYRTPPGSSRVYFIHPPADPVRSRNRYWHLILRIIIVRRAYPYYVYTNTTEPVSDINAPQRDTIWIRKTKRVNKKMIYSWVVRPTAISIRYVLSVASLRNSGLGVKSHSYTMTFRQGDYTIS